MNFLYGQNARKFILIGALILLISLIFLCSIKKELNIDEYEHIHATWKVSVGEKIYSDFFEHHHPLLYYIASPIVILSGDRIRTIFALRCIIFLMFLIILFYVYKLAVLFFDSDTSNISLLILSATPTFIARVIEFRPDVPMTLFALAAIYYLFYYFKTSNTRALVFSSFNLSLSFLFLQKAIFLVIFLHFILIFKLIKKRIRYKEILLFILTFAFTLVPFYLFLIWTHSLKTYFFNCWIFNKAWLARQHLNDFTFAFITKLFLDYFNPFNSIFYILFYTTGLLFFLKKEEQKIIGLLSLAILISVETSRTLWPQYYMIFIPLMAVISSYSFGQLIKNQDAKLILLILFLIYPSFGLSKILKTRPIKKELGRIKYVLDNIDPSQPVYDGYDLGNNSRFNLFRKDIDFFWWSLHPWEALPIYIRMTDYYYDIYQRIETKKPELIRNYLIDVNYPFIRKYYSQVSDRYPRYYILKLHCLVDKIILKYWFKTFDRRVILLLDNMNPAWHSFGETIKVGDSLYSKGYFYSSKKWYKAALDKHPVDRDLMGKLLVLYKQFNDIEHFNTIKNMLKKTERYIITKKVFEHGLGLEAISLLHDVSDKRILKSDMILEVRKRDINHTAFISFYKDGKFRFAKDFSLLHAKPKGELYEISDTIQIPLQIPSGSYRVYFTFRLPRNDYRYRLLHNYKLSKLRKTFIKKIEIK